MRVRKGHTELTELTEKSGVKVDIETTNLSNLHTFFFNTNYHVIDHELFMNYFFK